MKDKWDENTHTHTHILCPTNGNNRQVNALMSLCDNPIYGLSVELSAKACDVVRSCVAGALTATREVVEVALEVRDFARKSMVVVLEILAGVQAVR